jgi:ACT domain-containing protein
MKNIDSDFAIAAISSSIYYEKPNTDNEFNHRRLEIMARVATKTKRLSSMLDTNKYLHSSVISVN